MEDIESVFGAFETLHVMVGENALTTNISSTSEFQGHQMPLML